MSMQPTGHGAIVKDKHGTGQNLTMGTIAWIIAVCTFGYMAPWAIAVSRGKTNSTAIFFLNLISIFTFGILWIVALVMACSAHQVAYIPPAVQVHTTVYAGPVTSNQNALPVATVAAGWYPQPDGSQRWWDGAQWTDHSTAPGPVEPALALMPAQPPLIAIDSFPAPTTAPVDVTRPI